MMDSLGLMLGLCAAVLGLCSVGVAGVLLLLVGVAEALGLAVDLWAGVEVATGTAGATIVTAAGAVLGSGGAGGSASLTFLTLLVWEDEDPDSGPVLG